MNEHTRGRVVILPCLSAQNWRVLMTVRDADSTPAGARLANTTTRVEGAGIARPAAAGGVEFDPPNCQGVEKTGGPCSARRARGTMFCAGHLRQRGEL